MSDESVRSDDVVIRNTESEDNYVSSLRAELALKSKSEIQAVLSQL